MNIDWIFPNKPNPSISPAINDQLVKLTDKFLCLRNPWIPDSVLMGKMYAASTFFLIILQIYLWHDSHIWQPETFHAPLAAGTIIAPFFATPFLWYRLFLIKRLSHFYFDRTTKTIIIMGSKKTTTWNWNKCIGGFLQKTEFSGSAFSISYALAIAQRPENGKIKPTDAIWFPTNEPTECDPVYAQELWEYIYQFMNKGPDKLPPPGEPNWWLIPLNTICLTPKQAWRHYAPWRTGEPGEMQGKKNWMLPLWLVLFPYNMFVALCWCATCWMFKVKSPPPPV
ncbi:hypothetical protein ACIQUF_20615 [Pseudomonas sp. NPDC090233]|uniref:hypothetical protein n=1 Tax=Pseudomonas sp. NPDC090233 TaxID=3364479 RepID=UPI00383BC717